MKTANRVHGDLVGHLAAGGRLTLEWATSAEVDAGAGPVGLPLTRRTARRLAEGAALAAVYAEDGADVLNLDTSK